MQNNDLSILIEGFRKLSANIAEIADSLSHIEEEPVAAETPAKEYTFEEVRGILADKARAGFRAEIKALLTAHGVKQLSDITDPSVLATLAAEAEGFGND